jgi:hypothetical protein
MAKKLNKKPTEKPAGTFTAWPHRVADSVAFTGASFSAQSLLLFMARQHNGRNNGHIHAVFDWLKERGWKSSATLKRALDELMERGLIVKTRQGGFRLGNCKYALTWLPITDYLGLEIRPEGYRQGSYSGMDKLPFDRPKSNKETDSYNNLPTSYSEAGKPVCASYSEVLSDPLASFSEAVEPLFTHAPASEYEDNVLCHMQGSAVSVLSVKQSTRLKALDDYAKLLERISLAKEIQRLEAEETFCEPEDDDLKEEPAYWAEELEPQWENYDQTLDYQDE